jgi:hypothetical protein
VRSRRTVVDWNVVDDEGKSFCGVRCDKPELIVVDPYRRLALVAPDASELAAVISVTPRC